MLRAVVRPGATSFGVARGVAPWATQAGVLRGLCAEAATRRKNAYFLLGLEPGAKPSQ